MKFRVFALLTIAILVYGEIIDLRKPWPATLPEPLPPLKPTGAQTPSDVWKTVRQAWNEA
jgi:hypothetical protein